MMNFEMAPVNNQMLNNVRAYVEREQLLADFTENWGSDDDSDDEIYTNPNKVAICVYKDDQEPTEGTWYVAEVYDYETGAFDVAVDEGYSTTIEEVYLEVSLAELLNSANVDGINEVVTAKENEKEDEIMIQTTEMNEVEVETSTQATEIQIEKEVETMTTATETTATEIAEAVTATTETEVVAASAPAVKEQTGKYGLPSVLKDEYTVCLACGQLTKAAWFTSSHMKSCEVLKDKGFNYYVDNYLSKLDRPMGELVAEKMAEAEAKKNEPKPAKEPKEKAPRRGRTKKEKVDAAVVDAAQAEEKKAALAALVPAVELDEVEEEFEQLEVVEEEFEQLEVVETAPAAEAELSSDDIMSSLFA